MSQSEMISLIVNSIILILFLSISIVLISKIKMESKGYKLLFITYFVFWIPLMMTREYSGKVQKVIDENLTAFVLASYGFVGIFCRPFIDWLALRIRNRKIVLYSAVVVILVTFIPFISYPSTATSMIQSIGVGVGASMIGTYELMFKEQYTNNKGYLTVSLLAIPPLLADFVSSAIQSLLTTIPVKDVVNNTNLTHNNVEWNYLLIWLISIIFLFATFVLIFFVKEDRNKIGLYNKEKVTTIESNNSVLWFVIICLLGFIIAFVKFSNSGSVAILNIDSINSLEQNKYDETLIKSLGGYISLLFSIFQLIASFVIYWLTIVKRKVNLLFFIGIGSWLIYHVLIISIQNPIFYFSMSIFNGFAYGILYNLILGIVLNASFSSKSKITPMGIYQSVLAIGITSSSFFTPFVKNNLKQDFKTTNYIVNGIILGLLVVLSAIYLSSQLLTKKSNKKYIKQPNAL